jgi:hypothetical protein
MNDISWPVAIMITLIAVTVLGVGASMWTERIRLRHPDRAEADTKLASALQQSAEVNAKLLQRLDDIDGRLKSVEKTLNDIP